MLGPATTCTIDTTLSQPFDRYGTHTKNYKTVSIADSKYINTCRPSLCCVFLSLFLIRCSSLLLSMFAFKFAFVRSCIRSFVHSLVRSFVRSLYVRSFVCSFAVYCARGVINPLLASYRRLSCLFLREVPGTKPATPLQRR